MPSTKTLARICVFNEITKKEEKLTPLQHKRYLINLEKFNKNNNNNVMQIDDEKSISEISEEEKKEEILEEIKVEKKLSLTNEEMFEKYDKPNIDDLDFEVIQNEGKNFYVHPHEPEKLLDKPWSLNMEAGYWGYRLAQKEEEENKIAKEKKDLEEALLFNPSSGYSEDCKTLSKTHRYICVGNVNSLGDKPKIEYCSKYDVQLDYDSNNVGEIRKYNKVSTTKGLGVVCYMEEEFYKVGETKEDYEANKDIHFHFNKLEMLQILFWILTSVYHINETIIKNIFVGHEHGDKNKKCHYQCCLFFLVAVKRDWQPAVFIYKGKRILIMFQVAKNGHAIANYCKKEGDFCYLKEDDVINIKYFLK